MRNAHRSEGGMGFTGDSDETQTPEYKLIPKSSLSSEQQATYVAVIQTMGGLNGDKWKGRITKYFNENDYVIDLQQEGLNQFDLKKIFNEYSDDEEDTVPEVEDESYKEYLNNRSAENSKRYDSGLEGDRLNVSNNEKLEVESNYLYPTRLASESDYGDKSVLSDWLLIEKNSQEHELLIQGIKDKGVIPSLKLLNQIHPEIRNLKQKKEVSGEYLKFINATRELYGLPPYASEPEESAEGDQSNIDLDGQEPSLAEEVLNDDFATKSENDVITQKNLTPEQLEYNKRLYGWEASYELAKIAKSQNVDLSLLSREYYAEFAIKNKLMIDDNQLRMSPWQRMCESAEEINKKLEEIRSSINQEAAVDFNKFRLEIRQKAGESDRNIDNNIIVRKGAKHQESWLYFGINQGADSNEDQIFKSYISLQDLNDLTPEKFTNFMQALRDSGYNGDIKIFQDLLSQGVRLNDQIVMHGASEADAKLGLKVADQFFGDSLAHKSSGIDMKINGKSYSYSQVLAQKIKDSVQQEVNQESIEDNNFEALQQELERLIKVEVAKLQREEIVENLSYKIDREKLENFKKNARKTIADFQQFANEHSSPADKANPQIQEKYQLLEKQAWDSLYNLAHLLDGEIAILPQDRDIQLSHPEGVDIRQYLEARGYKFDENGDITHITDNGVEIELNRAMKTDSLIKSKRPSHIVYDKSISLDNDINYQGYLVRGLNQQTPDFIVGVLDKNNLESVIVDETNQETGEDENSSANLNPDAATDKSDEFAIVDDPEATNADLVDRLAQLREQYAEAEEMYNRHRNDPEAAKLFNDSRAEYNEALERMLKLKVAEGQEANIHQIFKDEVMSLRDSRIEQSQELQGKWEKRFNGAKEKFLGWATKNKRNWMIANISLLTAGGLLSLTGAGIPVAGALEVTRRSLGSVMSGVGLRNTLVGLMEDRDININKGFVKIKFQAVVPKIVRESISESEEQIKQVSDEVLKDRLGTLEAYYRLNGGKFTDNQQKAYEKVLTELGHRVRRNTLENYYNEQAANVENNEAIESNPDNLNEPNNQAEQDSQSSEIVHSAKFNFAEAGQSSRYTSELLNTISDTRITELDKFRKNRKIATIAGLATTGILGGTLVNDMVKPGGLFNPNVEPGSPSQISPDQTTGPGINPEVTPPSATEIPPTGTEAGAGEALRQAQEAAAATEQAQELARDVSSLSQGETLWGEIAKQLGPNASPDQIQHALENYLESGVGQNTTFDLAQGTEGGRALLAQWGIDNANEMASLSKEQLYEISRYLAPGELEGISNFNIDHLEAFQPAEYVAPSPAEAGAPTIEPGSTTPVAPSVSEAPITPQSPEVPPVEGTEFTRGVSEALGTINLTETQLQEAIYSFATSEQGSVELYNQIISNEEGARFLSGFGVNNAADFANLRPDELYEIAQTVGVENLDKLPGFELNEIILSKFEDAPDMVELARGTRPLDVVQEYISSELGNLPYDSNLGKQVLDTYVQTDAGKQWLYDAIVSNPNPNNQNVQLFREYLRFKDIKSSEEFVTNFNWSEFSGNRNIPTSGFWNQIRLPNGGSRLQPLSTFLQPSQMTGIKEAVRQVLTRQ